MPVAYNKSTVTLGPSVQLFERDIMGLRGELKCWKDKNRINKVRAAYALFYSVVDAAHGKICAGSGKNKNHVICVLAVVDLAANKDKFMDILLIKSILWSS